MLACVARDGYARTTVPAVVATARVSRNAFYEFFADKEDCFIAACDEAAGEMLADLRPLAAAASWTDATAAGFEVYLRWWEARPEFSRAYFVELPAAGKRAVDQRDRAYKPFRAMFHELAALARREQPNLPPLPDLVPRMIVIGVTELVAEEVRAGRGERLSELADDLTWYTVRLLADDETAERVRRRTASLAPRFARSS